MSGTSTPEPGEETPEAVGDLFGEFMSDIDELLANRSSQVTEDQLQRLLDGAPPTISSEPGGADQSAAAASVVAAAERQARRIVADAHRRADEIVTAARRRAGEHTTMAVRESVATLIEARLTADRLTASAGAGALPRRVAASSAEVVRPRGGDVAGDGAATPAEERGDGADLVVWWAKLLGDAAGPLAPAHADLAGLLSALVDRLNTAVAAGPGDVAAGEAVGQQLVDVGLCQPEMLGCTVEVLARCWLPTAGSSGRGQAAAALLGAVATGYAEQLRSLVRDQQAAVQQAVRSATQQVELSLRAGGVRGHGGIALFDPLTGLPSRTMFTERLDAARARAGLGRHLGVCVLDLAGFKTVNDSFGTAVGDRVLARIARRLTALVGEQDHLVARLGSDEFAVLIEDSAGTAQMIEVADKVLAAVAEPVSVESCRVALSGRVGLAEAPTTAVSAGRLLRDAETALVMARDAGADRAWYQPQAPRRRSPHGESDGPVDVTDFELRYERVVSLADGAVRRLEVRPRYRHPLLQDLDPDQVSDLAGDSSWLPNLFTRTLDTACRDAAGWSATHSAALSVSMPVAHLSPAYLIEQIDKTLAATGLPAERLSVDVPEHFAAGNIDQTYALTAQLAARGVQVGISDVGIGYTTLGYLRGLPLSTLTFHRSLVNDLGSSTSSTGAQEIVRAMVSLAQSLGLATMVRGVSTQRTVHRLVDLGVDLAQGRHFGGLFTSPEALSVLDAPAYAPANHDR